MKVKSEMTEGALDWYTHMETMASWLKPGGRLDWKHVPPEEDGGLPEDWDCHIRCPNTFYICSKCYESSVPGNVFYGFISEKEGVPFSRMFAEKHNNPFNEWPKHDECAYELGKKLAKSWNGQGADLCDIFNEDHTNPQELPAVSALAAFPFTPREPCELQKPPVEACEDAPPCDYFPGPRDEDSVTEEDLPLIWPVNTLEEKLSKIKGRFYWFG